MPSASPIGFVPWIRARLLEKLTFNFVALRVFEGECREITSVVDALAWHWQAGEA